MCEEIVAHPPPPPTRDVRHVHQLRLEPVDEGAEGHAALPRGRQVRDGHIPVALRLLLAPGEQPRRSDLRLCVQRETRVTGL